MWWWNLSQKVFWLRKCRVSSSVRWSCPDPDCDGTCTSGSATGDSTCFGEPSGGVHVCALKDAYFKCGTMGKEVVCCCHSGTCPSACWETSLTDVCGIDDALDVAGIIIKDQSLYNCMKANIDACNIRGFAGDGQTYVTTQPTSCIDCPSGGATIQAWFLQVRFAILLHLMLGRILGVQM